MNLEEVMGQNNPTRTKDWDAEGEYTEREIDGSHAKFCVNKLAKSTWGKDWEVYVPTSNVLTLDFDSSEVPDSFLERIPMLQRRFGKSSPPPPLKL